MGKEILDYTVVPLGFLIMAVYHMWLLRQICRRPAATIIGINAINRRSWVLTMMEISSTNGILPIQILRNNIMASTVLASAAIMLSAAVTVMMIGGCGGRGGRPMLMIYGEKSELGFLIKFFSILLFLLMTFFFSMQSIKYYSQASILIIVPNKNTNMNCDCKKNIRAEYVCRTVNRGSYFWSLGLRTFYFSGPLFMWIFGPIPMFLCCVSMVMLLYFLDVNVDGDAMVCNCI
ncbi:uncharacterized protein LOC127245611 isoform X2 [Andrographis paniculata]|nr:uncharacterized protein LOC127245611 isoform X2 [Andrographis paniculata]